MNDFEETIAELEEAFALLVGFEEVLAAFVECMIEFEEVLSLGGFGEVFVLDTLEEVFIDGEVADVVLCKEEDEEE